MKMKNKFNTHHFSRILFIMINLLLMVSLFGQKNEEDITKNISMHADDASIASILAMLAAESGYNIVTDPTVNSENKISIHLDDVPVEQAINLVVRAVGLSYEVVGNSFLVAEHKKLKEEVGITSEVITLKYVDAQEVKMLLQDISDQIQVDVSGNKLLVNASPKKIAEIKDVISEIDVPALQIMLETRLIEIAVDAEEQLGLDWSKLSKVTTIVAENAIPPFTGAGSLVPGLKIIEEADGSFSEDFSPLPLEQKPSQMYFQRLGSGGIGLSRQMLAFEATLDLLLKNNTAEVLADSRLTTLNGRKASIKLVDIVPYILSSGGVGGQVQVQREEVGIKLEILPTVNTDGFITVKVEPEVSTIFEFIGPDKNIPRVKSRTSSTTIRVKDSQSIIIGGLLSNDRKETYYSVPFLSKIPYIGKKLFTSKNLVDRKTDLIIQITPRIISDTYVGIQMKEEMKGILDRVYTTDKKTENHDVDDLVLPDGEQESTQTEDE
jgi:type II secretory pathway component GspD/PulD (secretin)